MRSAGGDERARSFPVLNTLPGILPGPYRRRAPSGGTEVAATSPSAARWRRWGHTRCSVTERTRRPTYTPRGICARGPPSVIFGTKVIYPRGYLEEVLVVPEVDLHTFAAAHSDGALVIDVREPHEYVTGHV